MERSGLVTISIDRVRKLQLDRLLIARRNTDIQELTEPRRVKHSGTDNGKAEP